MDKSLYHTGENPWQDILISGHALSADRRKISKSKEHAEAGPMALIEQESADALRYWATSVKAGGDTHFHPETLAMGRRLVTKLWNAARFAERHLQAINKDFLIAMKQVNTLLPTDRWLLSRLAATIAYATGELKRYEYAAARAEVERFFWSDLCDNYLELAKARLYNERGEARDAACWTLYHALLAVLKLLAPYMPYITEEIYQALFREHEGAISVHRATWPGEHPEWIDSEADEIGRALLDLLHKVRRYKAERGLSIGAELETLRVVAKPELRTALEAALIDIKSATRARNISFEKPGSSAVHESEQVLFSLLE